MKPTDLRELAGSIYRISHDPAAFHEPGGRKNPWLYIIPCRKGRIYPHSDTMLALWWESSARLDLKCSALTLYLDGDEEKDYLFAPGDFEEVAKVAQPKRRRRGRTLTEPERQKAIERLRPHWYAQNSHST